MAAAASCLVTSRRLVHCCHRDAEAALQAAVAESAKLCSWLLARAPSPAELAAATALPAWPGVASSLTAEQLPAALWPYLIQAAASCDQAAEDRLRRFLQVQRVQSAYPHTSVQCRMHSIIAPACFSFSLIRSKFWRKATGMRT